MSKAETYREIREQIYETLSVLEDLRGNAERLDDSTLNRELSKAACLLMKAELRAATGEDAEVMIDGLSPEGQAFVRR